MEFTEKYISEAEKLTSPADKRVILGNDAYAIREGIDELMKVIINFRGMLRG